MSELRSTSKAITLVVTCLGMFMILLDSSIVILAVPKIQVDLHASLSELQWVIDAYTLPFAVLMLTAGTFGDRFGRKRVFLFGLILFTLGSALCGFASAMSWLIAGRIVQGVGAAALSTSSLSVLVVAFPEPRQRAQAIGLWSGVSGVALAVGPFAGGILTQIGNWPAIFQVNLPIGLVTLLVAWMSLSESRNPKAQRIDLAGQLLVIVGLTCLVMGLIEGSSVGWLSPLIIGLFVGALGCLIAFLIVEMRVREPLFPLEFFGQRAFSVANAGGFIFGFASVGVIFFLAQYFQQVQGNTVLEAGIRTFPISIGAFLTAPFAGVLAGRIGPRIPIILGGLLCGGAMGLLVGLEPDTSYTSLWWVLGFMGIGMGLLLSPLTVAVFSAMPPERSGLGASMLNTSRQIGITLGIAVLGSVAIQQFSGNIVYQLTQRGVSDTVSIAVANKVAAAGGQASQTHLAGHLPISPAAMHLALNQAFVDALHGVFLISSIATLVVAVLAVLFLQRRQLAVHTSTLPVDQDLSMTVSSAD